MASEEERMGGKMTELAGLAALAKALAYALEEGEVDAGGASCALRMLAAALEVMARGDE